MVVPMGRVQSYPGKIYLPTQLYLKGDVERVKSKEEVEAEEEMEAPNWGSPIAFKSTVRGGMDWGEGSHSFPVRGVSELKPVVLVGSCDNSRGVHQQDAREH